MERFSTLLRESPALIAITVFVVITTVLMLLFGALLHRSGASLKPLVFFVGFLGIVAGPQGAVHLLDALTRKPAPASKSVTSTAPATTAVPLLSDWSTVFGPGIDPALITDARRSLAEILSAAEEAPLAFRTDGSSALAARFPTEAAARDAYARYVRFFQLPPTPEGPNRRTGRRYGGQGEWNRVALAGREMYAWTGPSLEDVSARSKPTLGDDSASLAAPAAANTSVSGRLRQNLPLMLTFLVLNVLAATVWFFQGSAWAGRIGPAANAVPASLETLEARLQASTGPEQPWEVARGSTPGSWEVTWRYADARWLEPMRLRSIQRVHRLVLQLEPDSHVVRVVEYATAFDTAAGADGASVRWRKEMGLTFFQTDYQHVLGVELGPDGRPTGSLSTGFSFNLQELKAPFIAATTNSGWTWQPVVWDAPRWLRWLTE